MPRYKLFIEYNGTSYHGWQKQPNAHTIQEVMEEAFSRILQENISIVGQGRTDSGVHAEAQIAHVDIIQQIDKDKLLYALLGVLPRDISVWDINEAAPDFHARFDAKSRQYRYQITTRPSPLYHNVAKLVRYDLDRESMQTCAKMIEGTHDFECFSKADRDQPNAVCTVALSEFVQDDHLMVYRIRGNRFVHHMVRRLIGSMLLVGKGQHSVAYFSDLLHYPDEQKTSHGAPAKGLILEEVKY